MAVGQRFVLNHAKLSPAIQRIAEAFEKTLKRESQLMTLQRRFGRGKASRLCPGSSDADLFGDGEGVIDLNAEIPDGALDFGLSQQQLRRAVGTDRRLEWAYR
jgi:hypothetical protein